MSEYYYNCPLKAAYMAKYFGMGIYVRNEDSSNWFGAFNVTEALDKKGKWYISNASLHILEPHIGDIGVKDGERVAFRSVMGWKETPFNSPDDDNYQIIQRKGIPFMWPEVEYV